MGTTLTRLTPLSGIAFVATMVAVVAFEGDEVADGATPEVVLAHWADKADLRLLMGFLSVLALTWLLLFASSLRGALRAREPSEATASIVCFGGATVAAAGLAISGMVTVAAGRAGGEGDAAAVMPLHHLSQSTWLPVTAGLGVMLMAAAVGGLRSGALPKLLCWAGLVLGIAFLTPAGILAFLVTPLWLIATSVVLYRQQSRLSTVADALAGPTP
jgi:hypothetical protein